MNLTWIFQVPVEEQLTGCLILCSEKDLSEDFFDLFAYLKS